MDEIRNEDCFVTMQSIQPVDAVFTSPPYNMTKRKGGNGDTGRYDVYSDWMDYTEYRKFTTGLFRQFDRIVKRNGVVLYNFSYSVENPALPYTLVSDIVNDTVWALADTIVWVKKNSMPFPANPRRLSRQWEFVWVFARKTETETFCTNRRPSSQSPSGQTYYDVGYNVVYAQNNDAPTPDMNQATFSSELVKKVLSMYVGPGSVVYDPFMGTGTTAVGCRMIGCHYIGSEISQKQCEYARERVRRYGSSTIQTVLPL